eukprot:6212190-Pleurochrysis_carterae.AAC.4
MPAAKHAPAPTSGCPELVPARAATSHPRIVPMSISPRARVCPRGGCCERGVGLSARGSRARSPA